MKSTVRLLVSCWKIHKADIKFFCWWNMASVSCKISNSTAQIREDPTERKTKIILFKVQKGENVKIGDIVHWESRDKREVLLHFTDVT